MDKNIPIYLMKDFTGISSISFSVGTRCNMRCRHCIETPIKEKEYNVEDISPKVWQFLCNFTKFSFCAKIPSGSYNQILFWGGEPLLYWDYIKQIILRLESETKVVFGEKIVFKIITNGLLLTEDKVRFINEHKIMVGFSYDAPHPFAVRGRVSDKICELANQIDNLEIFSSGSTNYSYDVLLIYNCLKAKFPKAKVYTIQGDLIYSFPMDSDIVDYDWDKIRESYRKLSIAAKLGNQFALRRLLFFFRLIGNKQPREEIPDTPYCLQTNDDIAITYDGKCSFCNKCGFYLNTIEDTWEKYIKTSCDYARSVISPKCKDCKYLHLCQRPYGRCILHQKDEDGYFVMCKKYFFPFYEMIDNELKNLTQPLTEEDKSWFKEQEKIMEQQVKDFLNEGKI